MAIVGAHALLYSTEPDALRAMCRDVFGWSHVDAGGGWLIFALPPAELGIHPNEGPTDESGMRHRLSLMCDDIGRTIGELRAKGVGVVGDPVDQGYGITVMLNLPGGVEVQLYEPRHPVAIQKPSSVPAQQVMPTLRISDYATRKAFYVEKLGFQIDWEHRFKPDFPVFMQVSRSGLAFFLTEHKGDCPAGGLVHLYVPDVDAWYADFQKRGAPVQEPPNEGLQGLRSMVVRDPDGNKISVHTRLPNWRRS